jgi:hypothetical protein
VKGLRGTALDLRIAEFAANLELGVLVLDRDERFEHEPVRGREPNYGY